MLIPINTIMVAEAKASTLSVDEASDTIAALGNMAFTAGTAAGPFASGSLVHHIGFQRATGSFGFFLALTTLLLVPVGWVRASRLRQAASLR